MGLFRIYLELAIQRQRLTEMVEKQGHQDPRVLAQSKKVDRLVAEIQRRRLAG